MDDIITAEHLTAFSRYLIAEAKSPASASTFASLHQKAYPGCIQRRRSLRPGTDAVDAAVPVIYIVLSVNLNSRVHIVTTQSSRLIFIHFLDNLNCGWRPWSERVR